MTKNVVQRLQTINQDLSSIISIYDLTSETKKSDDESQKKQNTQKLPEMDTSECSESSTFCNQRRHLSHTLFDSVTKSDRFVTRPSKSINSHETVSTVDEELQKGNKQKPGSAPTSTNSTYQSDYTWRQSLGLSRKLSETDPSSKGKPFHGSCQTLWYDCRSCMDCSAVNTPIDITESANTSMTKNYEERDERKGSKPQAHRTTSKFETNDKEDGKNFVKPNTNSVTSTANLKKGNEVEGSAIEGSRAFSSKAEISHDTSEIESEFHTSDPVAQTPSTTLKHVHHLKKDRASDRSSRSPTRVLKTMKTKDPSPESKSTTQTTSTSGNSKPRRDEDAAHDGRAQSNIKLSERINSRVKQAEKLFGDKSEEKKSEREKKSRNTQKNTKDAGDEGMQQLVNETNAILSKSAEKLEKMKSSKELALTIAKQLKDKCDDLKQSKEELMHKLHKAEKENKRLSIGLKAAELSEKRVQIKFEGLKNESKNKLSEQETRGKKAEEEGNTLKIRMPEREKPHTEEPPKKQKDGDQIQKERVHEIKNAMKARETRPGDFHRLTGEKRDLQMKVDELRDLLTKSNLKAEKLEEENRRLQHIQSQNQFSKENVKWWDKKDPQEAQNELESIRQNSRDLEEQVKTLRKSIEGFDEVQQKLVTRTQEYQKQMELGLEDIEKLKNENAKLKEDLENEKDSLLIKTKIIEDQQETIKQLKAKSEEVKTLVKKNQSLERILNIEREEKLELEEAVEHLNRRKEELKKKIKNLESDLLLAPQEVVRDLQKTQVVLHELENQVQAKQKEWEFHLQCLIRQKEQACNVAEFATKKLMRTTSEFQKQTEAYKALQRILAQNISVKGKFPGDVNRLHDAQS